MKKYLILISLFISTILGAQSFPECGTTPSKAQIEYLNQTRTERSAFSSHNYKSNAAIQVPVVNHIVTQSNGSGGLELQELADAMQTLNDFYAQANIQFVECEPTHFIHNSAWYHFNHIDDETIRSANDIPKVLNIYHFESVKIGNNQVCGYASLPTGPDRIMMANNCTKNGTTLIHEVGHYFSLYHTHGKSNFGTTDELVDGTNCEIAGDDVCDTPADPNLLGKVQGCQYIGTETDANGQPYTPQVNNIMSYSSCRSVFTQGQFDRVIFSALNDRNYLTCNGSSPTCTATVSSFPYSESFETENSAWSPITIATSCSNNWARNSGGTSSSATGPSGAAHGTHYLYTESSGACKNTTMIVESPCFDISSLNSPALTFDYHMYGSSMGTLALEVSVDDGNSWTELWAQTGNQGDSWLTANVNLGTYTSGTFTLRFKGTTGNSYQSDMAIDKFNIQDSSCPSAGTPCDDNDICTINDTYDNNCNCTGTFQDTDMDGICDAEDPCPTIPGINCSPLVTYCSAQGDTGYEFIESVQIGTITNTSGNDNGYGDYTANTSFDIGNFNTPITLTPGFSGQAYKENWKIWIDLNKDGDFKDEGEEVFSGTSVENNPLSGTIKVSSANDIQTTMRIAMVWNVAATSCSMIDAGEFEDYTVNLSTVSNKSAVETNLVEVYPNPAKDYINADIHDIISAGNIQSLNALIYDMKGQLMHSETLNATGVLTINTQHLTEAPYILRLQTDDGRAFTSKFLKL